MAIQADHKDIKQLIMGDHSQFHIPIYQRSYTWEAKDQVDRLLQDITEFGREFSPQSRADYYIGNVILKNQTRAFVNERIVIDGQQRITTTILILCAIRDIYLFKIKSNDSKIAAGRINKALFTDEDGTIKLKLNNMEFQQTLELIMTGQINALCRDDKNTMFYKNYMFIYKFLSNYSEPELEEFVSLLERVKVVIIFLDEEQDENSVFESINSLGKRLEGSDLIKNFLFTFKRYHCTRTEETKLINLYTKSVESLFEKEKKKEHALDLFFREYTAIKTGQLIKKDPKVIYYSFKKEIGAIPSYKMCETIILDVAKWAFIYQLVKGGESHGLNKNDLRYLRTQFGTYASLLMDVIEKKSTYENGSVKLVKIQDINDIIKVIVAYDVSRFLRGYSIKEVTRFIATIPNKLKQEREDYYNDYANLLRNLFFNTNEGYSAPSKAEILKNLHTINFYKKRIRLVRFLVLIENIGKKEYLDFEKDLTGIQIEHIMPQSKNQHWKHISEEEHSDYVHTLGNLSITFDNQGLSARSFLDKKDYLRKHSKITLNHLLDSYYIFDITDMHERAEMLCEKFFNEYLPTKNKTKKSSITN